MKMISLKWNNEKQTKSKKIDKSVYFELLVYDGGKPVRLDHIHGASNAYLRIFHGFETSLEDTTSSLKRLAKSGDAIDMGNYKWRVRMEFTVEEKRKAKKLSRELSVPLPESKLIKLAKKSGNSISDLLCQFSEFAHEPWHRQRGYLREAREYLENFENYKTLMSGGTEAKLQLHKMLNRVFAGV